MLKVLPLYRQGYISQVFQDDASNGCLLTETEECAVCGEGEQEELQDHPTVKNYRQGGLVRIVVQFNRTGFTSTNQFRICQRDGNLTLHSKLTPDLNKILNC